MHESGSVMGQSFNLPSLSLQSAVVKAAHAHNLLAVAHSLCLEDTLAILKTGVDGMMHTFADKPPTEELLEAYKKTGTFCVPTLGALASATGEGKTTQQAFADDPRVTDLIAETSRENMCRCMEFAAKTSKMENAYENVRQLRAAGIDILWYVLAFCSSYIFRKSPITLYVIVGQTQQAQPTVQPGASLCI